MGLILVPASEGCGTMMWVNASGVLSRVPGTSPVVREGLLSCQCNNVLTQGPPLVSCVSLSKPFKLSEPQFL